MKMVMQEKSERITSQPMGTEESFSSDWSLGNLKKNLGKNPKMSSQ